MRVLGKFMGDYNSMNFAIGGYVAFDAQWINVETYKGCSIVKDER